MLTEFHPFDIFDTEAARLDRFFGAINEDGWARPTRCAGWSVRDVLAHLAGEELYNHACLDGEVQELFARLQREGISGFDDFNQWCVRQRRDLPVAEVLQEWRTKNAETRRRTRELGREAMLQTSAGPYPNGFQAFHYDSEYATHADDIGAPVSAQEAQERTRWRVAVGRFALEEVASKAQVDLEPEHVLVHVDGVSAQLSHAEFVEATVGRLPAEHPLDQGLRAALRCLA